MIFSGSPLISIETSPVETSCDLASITKATKKATINVNESIPKYISIRAKYPQMT